MDPRAELIAKAVKDPSFRAALLKDPAAAIAKSTGMKLPDGLAVKVLEDSASTVHLVLPPAPAALSQKELEKIAGAGPCSFTSPGYCDSTSPTPFCK